MKVWNKKERESARLEFNVCWKSRNALHKSATTAVPLSKVTDAHYKCIIKILNTYGQTKELARRIQVGRKEKVAARKPVKVRTKENRVQALPSKRVKASAKKSRNKSRK